jgi:hypothetical protein
VDTPIQHSGPYRNGKGYTDKTNPHGPNRTVVKPEEEEKKKKKKGQNSSSSRGNQSLRKK